MTERIEYMRVNNDSNGNPRYVVHFYNLLSDQEQKEHYNMFIKLHGDTLGLVNYEYLEAINKAKAIGGKRYRGKDFGGGIVFQSYNIRETLKDIADLRGDK